MEAQRVAPGDDWCPYVGLRPFTAGERAYFFGRNQEARVIGSNVLAAPLTVLYGPSAVGKSSVLQAGVIPRLACDKRTVVVYFNRWQDARAGAQLKAATRAAVEAAVGDSLDIDEALPLDEWIEGALARLRGRIHLLLDQFEEYLLYHGESCESSIDAELARAINAREGGAHFLFGLRDDGLARLDRFRKRIPNLLGNLLRLRRLDEAAAREAIQGPLAAYNRERVGSRSAELQIDSQLVESVLEQVRADRVRTQLIAGQGSAVLNDDRTEIETAYLQLVMARLWRAREAVNGAQVLRQAALDRLGGAEQIVKSHFDEHIQSLEAADAGVADMVIDIFPHLVTPTGSKIAQNERDLVAHSPLPPERIRWFLHELAEARLLRITDPPERYEIFHDALAKPVLDCRQAYVERRLERTRVRDQRDLARRRRLRAGLVASALLLLLTTLFGWWAWREAHQQGLRATYEQFRADEADKSRLAAESRRLQADAQIALTEISAQARELQLQARELELEARSASVDAKRVADIMAQAAAASAAAQQQQLEAAKRATDAERFEAQARDSAAKAAELKAGIDGDTSPTQMQVGVPAGQGPAAVLPPTTDSSGGATPSGGGSHAKNASGSGAGTRPSRTTAWWAAIEQAIERYRAAFEKRDVAALRSLLPQSAAYVVDRALRSCGSGPVAILVTDTAVDELSPTTATVRFRQTVTCRGSATSSDQLWTVVQRENDLSVTAVTGR